MATGGTGGMKYQLMLAVDTNTKSVDQLTKSVDALSKSLSGLQSKGAVGANSLAGGLASANAQGYFLAATLERAGRQSLFFAKSFATATVGSFTSLLHEAANLEQFIIRLQSTQGTTKKDALDIFNYTIKATTHLPLTEAQLVRIATTFKQRGMDIREAFGGKTYEDVIKSGHAVEGLASSMGKAGKEGVGLLDLFSDLATTQGQLATEDIGKFVREFSEFMATGQTRFLRTRLDPALLHELNNTKANSGKAMEVIYDYLAKRNAIGVSRLSMQTFSGVITNFKGLPQRIANAVFQPGLTDGMARKFSLALAAAFETINEYFDESTEKGKKFLPELRRIFDFIGSTGIAAIKGLTAAFTKFADFLSNNPGIGKFMVMVGSLIAGLLALKGVLFLARASLLTIALAGKLVAGVTSMLNISTGLLALKYAGLIAIGGVLFAMFRKVGVVIGAVHEAMTNYDPNTGLWTIARKTYDELQQGGLMGLFEKLLEFGMKIKLLFENKLSLEQAFPAIASLKNFLWTLGEAFVHVVDVVLGVKPATDVANDGMSASAGNAKDLSVAIQKAADVGAQVATVMAKDIPLAIADAVDGFASFINFIDNAASALLYLGTVMAGVASIMAFSVGDVVHGAALAGVAVTGLAAAYGINEVGDRDPVTRNLKMVGSMHERAAAIRGRANAGIAGEERGKFVPSDEMTVFTAYTADGQTHRVPMAGAVRDQSGEGLASYARAPGSYMAGSDPLAGMPYLKALEKTKVTSNVTVNIDGKRVATAVSAKAEVASDRAGDTGVGGMTPMNSVMSSYAP